MDVSHSSVAHHPFHPAELPANHCLLLFRRTAPSEINICVSKHLSALIFILFPDLIVKVIQQNMGGIKVEEWQKVCFIEVPLF